MPIQSNWTQAQINYYNALIEPGHPDTMTDAQATAEVNSVGTSNGTPMAIEINGVGNTGETGPGGASSDTLPTVTITDDRPPITSLLPNPMHQFASWTYNWSMWWLDVADFNKIMSATDPAAAMAVEPGPKSYVVAEDSGKYPDRRVPSPALNSSNYGLNYNIQEVSFTTTIGPNKTSRSSNMIDGKLVIVEPYGVTFIDTLVDAGFDGTKYINYTQQPYMLQLDFVGYDDAGQQIPPSKTALYRKRFPIKLVSCDIDIDKKGAQYNIEFTSSGGWTHYPEMANTYTDITITAGTVQEFFDEFAKKLNNYFQNNITNGSAQYADSYKFVCDTTTTNGVSIASATIVDPNQATLQQTNPGVQGIKFDKKTFTIPHNTPILDVITRIMIQSSFMTSSQGIGTASPSSTGDQTNPLKVFKTTSQIIYAGMDIKGTINNNVVDSVRGQYPVQAVYHIDPYTTWKGEHPAGPVFSDSRNYTIKNYNYIYTGQNIDVLDFKLKFDMTYYTALQQYNTIFAATQATKNTSANASEETLYIPMLTPSTLGTVISQIGQARNITPARFRNFTTKPNIINTGIEGNPPARVAADVVDSVFSGLNGDMINLDLKIVGDPTLLKQDDWLYAGFATGTQSAYDYAQQYGHIPTDRGEVVVGITLNTPIDLDLDISNQGLVYPPPGMYPSLFSGQYRIITIENHFSNGVFEQVLSMARYINHDLIDQFASGTLRTSNGTVTPVQQSIQNGSNSGVNSNSSTTYQRL